MKVLLAPFLRSETGSTAIEYALIVAIMGIPLIFALLNLGGEYDRIYDFIVRNVMGALNQRLFSKVELCAMVVSTMIVFLSFMLLAIVSDIRSMTIPNRLNLALAAAFVLSAILVGMPIAAAGVHFVVGALALLVTAAMFHFGWMGGGDAKLIAATALWFGPSLALLDYLVLASIFGGVVTLVLLGARAVQQPTTGMVFLDRLLQPRGGIPYGVALGAAGLVVSLQTDWTAVFG